MRPKLDDPMGPNGLRVGYRWAYGEPGLSTEDLMRPETYSRPRPISQWPDRRLRASALRCSDGIATMSPKTLPAMRAKEAYALRQELGDRAYAELTGRRVRRTATKPKVVSQKSEVVEAVRRRADGTSPVVLSDHEMMKALGIKPVGYLD